LAIKVAWENDRKKVLVSIYQGAWDLNDFYAATEEINTLMDTVDHKVNLILDMRESGSLPKGFIGALRATAKKRHPHFGRMIFVGGNMFVRMFNDLFLKLYPRPDQNRVMYMAADYEEAYAILERIAE
jgi:hypothetical protein